MRTFVIVVLVALIGSTAHTPATAGRAADVRRESFELLNQGVAAYRRGEFAEAVRVLERAQAIALNSFSANYYLGLALLGDRRPAPAIESLLVAIDLEPRHLQALAALGDAYLSLGDLSEARAAFTRALKLGSSYAPAMDGLARGLEAAGDDTRAIEQYRSAIAANAGYAPPYTHLGDLLLRRGRIEEAVTLLEEAVAIRPDFGEGLNRLAAAYGRLGLVDEALVTARRAIEVEPSNADHRVRLGELELEGGLTASAARSFAAALELRADSVSALIGLAEIARRSGDWDRAFAQLDLASALDPLDSRQSTVLNERRQRYLVEREALTSVASRIAAGAATPADLERSAEIHAMRGEWNEAADLRRQAAGNNAMDERLAWYLLRASRPREALAIYERLALDSAESRHEVNRGVAHVALGAETAAEVAFRKALEEDPARAVAWLYLGNVYLRAERRPEAVRAYREFLNLDPQGEAAERVRRILRQIAPDQVPHPIAPAQAAGAPG